MKKSRLCLFSILSLFSHSAFSQTVLLDSTFGAGGKVTTALNLNSAGIKIALQADGKIVAVGGNNSGDFVVARYNSDGTIDNTFGTGGVTTTDLGGTDNASDVAIAQDGTIIVAGTSGSDFALAAYNASDGSLKSSFGSGGKVVTDFGGADSCKALALQSDGRIVVVGSTASTTKDYALIRYNADGSTDNTFGTNGKVQTDFSGDDDQANGVAVQADGKIVVCGTSTQNDADVSVARYSSDGSLDGSFATGGQLLYDFKNRGKNNYAYALAIQPDGGIVIVGSIGGLQEAFPATMGIFRITPGGTFDVTFNQDGIRRGKFGGYSFASAHSVALQADGKILVGGSSYNTDGSSAFALIRLKSDGNADSSFALGMVDQGYKGRITTSFDNSAAFSFGIALQPDGKTVMGGFANNTISGNNNEIALLRYLPHYLTLPLDFVSFSLVKNQKSVSLNWKVANEVNNSYFTIERSDKGNTGFTEIGRVASKRSANTQQYAFEDLSPLIGGNFYRLKQVDLDGHATYSNIIYANFSRGIVIRLFPNPVTDKFTVDGLKAGSNTTISILNLQGSVIAKAATTNASYNWNLKQIPAGTYFLRVEVDGHMTTLKFVKQ